MVTLLGGLLRGKPQFPRWLWEAVARAAVLVCGTVLLMAARVKVMGAQLPVFTRSVKRSKGSGKFTG